MNIIGCLGLVAIVTISFGAKPVGYLARSGPAPLRFQAPAKNPEMIVGLPPLVMCDPPAATPHEPMTNETTTIEAPVPSPTTPLVVAPPSARVEPEFTPQALLQFFNRNGSNHEPSA